MVKIDHPGVNDLDLFRRFAIMDVPVASMWNFVLQMDSQQSTMYGTQHRFTLGVHTRVCAYLLTSLLRTCILLCFITLVCNLLPCAITSEAIS